MTTKIEPYQKSGVEAKVKGGENEKGREIQAISTNDQLL